MVRSPSQRIAAAALVLFAANLWVAFDLFTIEYLDQMDSIEAAYISLARWISEHPSKTVTRRFYT